MMLTLPKDIIINLILLSSPMLKRLNLNLPGIKSVTIHLSDTENVWFDTNMGPIHNRNSECPYSTQWSTKTSTWFVSVSWGTREQSWNFSKFKIVCGTYIHTLIHTVIPLKPQMFFCIILNNITWNVRRPDIVTITASWGRNLACVRGELSAEYQVAVVKKGTGQFLSPNESRCSGSMADWTQGSLHQETAVKVNNTDRVILPKRTDLAGRRPECNGPVPLHFQIPNKVGTVLGRKRAQFFSLNEHLICKYFGS